MLKKHRLTITNTHHRTDILICRINLPFSPQLFPRAHLYHLLQAALLKHGVDPALVAYIKPATQGVQPTLTAKYCAAKGVAYRHIGPIVFYRGFTHESV